MRKIENERIEWSKTAVEVDAHIDRAVRELKAGGICSPAAYIATDMIFRPYLKWLNSAQLNGVTPDETRLVIINLLTVFILEISQRMNSVDDEGRQQPLNEWCHDFVQDLVVNLSSDIAKIMGRPKQKPIITPN